MPSDPRPPYPRTPSYGEGHAAPGPAATPTPGALAADRRGVRLSLVLAVVLNLGTLAGVLLLGWPAGNVFLAFWCENVVLGLVTLVRVVTAQAPDGTRVSAVGRTGTAAFFCVHYGIFCVVHLVFTWLVASALGVDTSGLALGLPVVLVLVRYGVELATTWFGAGGRRQRTSPRAAMFAPYPRVAVLHLAVLLTFGGVLAGYATGLGDDGGRVTGVLLTHGVIAVGVLLALKTVVDLLTTRRALRVG